MKRIFKRAAVLLLAAIMVFGLAACKDDDKKGTGELDFNIVYTMAADLGFTGDLDDLIEAFKGDSAYEIAVSMGYGGSQNEWLATLKGAKGTDGVTPHIGANGNWWIGSTDTTVKARGKDGADGKDGANGTDGADGKSAYQIWLDNGGCGEANCDCTQSDFLEWLKGAAGKDGANGTDGKSAYQIWLDNGGCGKPNCDCTQADFLEWLKGEAGKDGITGTPGKDGEDGLSAYEIFKKQYPEYKGSELEWINALAMNRLLRTVTFMSSGKEYAVKTVLYGSALTDLPQPPAQNEWEAVDLSNVTENIVVYARYLSYSLNSYGSAYTVNGKNLNPNTEKIVIPQTYNGLPVSEIQTGGFSGLTALKEIVIPSSVVKIGPDAFSDTALMNNTAAGSPVYADNWVVGFKEDENGQNDVTLKEGTIGIAYSTFEKKRVTSVIMPDSVKYIGYYAFFCCPELTNVVLSKSLDRIEPHTFRQCDKLSSIDIPDSVTCIDQDTFSDCSLLGSITFSQESNLKSIGLRAFSNCVSLSAVHLPSSLKSLGDNAFRKCTALADITLPADNLKIVGKGVFENTAWLNNQPDGLVYLGKILYSYKGKAADGMTVTVKDGTKIIAAEALKGQTGLTRISIPASVVGIGSFSFSGCTNLADIEIAEGCRFEAIGESALYDTAWLSAQEDGLVYLGSALYNYKGAMPENTTLTLKEGTTAIADRAFYQQRYLTVINLPASLVYIGKMAFTSCSRLTQIDIPETVRFIGDRSFIGCAYLKSVTLLSDVYVDQLAFATCHVLTIYYCGESLPDGWNFRWNFSKRPVVLGCNTGEGGYIVSVDKKSGSILNANATKGISAPYRTGYTFGGWATSQQEAADGIFAYTAEELLYAPDDITFWAVWTAV